MSYMARWGPKGFLISPTKIVAMENLRTSVTLKSDSENDTSGTSPTNTRGREAIPISFSVKYIRAAGVDPRAQKEEWESLVGQSYPLYVGDKRFGPELMTLTEVDFDITLSNNGDFLSVEVEISLEEYSEGKKSNLKSSSTSSTVPASSASADKASATYAATVEKRRAMNAAPSSADRAKHSPAITKATLI